MTDVYRNYRMYSKRGRRLAIFATPDKNYDPQNPVVKFCIYECSPFDNFSKKKAFSHYLLDDKELKSICFTMNMPFDGKELNKYVAENYYRREDRVETVHIPTYVRKPDDQFLISKKNGKTKKLYSIPVM